ncbi:amylo-alpha-1,6-glucosidase [Nonomuraea sp. NPDC050663]|uniref:amylo-alpha-1,6-glucosidase n=1 Tax=Nonomuraea sp. NPDC050663 TaxID=3364370 RepID=UPI0037A12D82
MVELDLNERPFTERGSRLLVIKDDDRGLWIGRAEYETRLTRTTIMSGLRVFSGPRELLVRHASPYRVEFDDGAALEFADADTLVLTGEGEAVWEGGSAVLPVTLTGAGTLVPGAAEARWRAWLERMPPVPDDLRERAELAWWTLAINQIDIRGRTSVIPSKYGYVGLWNWDSYFHAIGLRHGDIELAREQIRILLDNQRPDGLIPDVVHDHGVLAETTDLPRSDIARMDQHVGGGAPREVVPVTKPPLTAWAVWKLHEAQPDLGFLREVYDRLVASQEWWFKHSDPDGDGLAEYLHPYSSGLDDSPIWDHGPRAEPPDLNSYLALQYDRLADIADALGIEHSWRDQAQALVDLMIAERWDGERFLTRPVPTRTPLELMPLFTGRLPREIADRLVADLTSKSFWAPVPSVAYDDPLFDPEAMWRGPVWLNINYLLIDGLRRSGYPEVASELAQKVLDLVGYGFYEYWNPLTGQGSQRATTGFGWSAALFLDLAATP